MSKCRIAYCVSTEKTVRGFLLLQLKQLKSMSFEFHVVCSGAGNLVENNGDVAQFHDVEIAREISLKKDVLSLYRLKRLLCRVRPDVVVSSTPKAGLLGTIAAWWIGVPKRVYHVRGLRYETASGLKRRVLLFCEWICCLLATDVICNAESLRDELCKERLCSMKKSRVLGHGSACGVDTEQFQRSSDLLDAGRFIRESFQISTASKVIGFVGRFTKDKGLADLVTVFLKLTEQQKNLELLLVGDFEEGDPIDPATIELLKSHPRIHLTGAVAKAEKYYAAFDLLAFPSKREGFPNAVLEAAAMELPVVGYRVTGVKDAIEDGVTGTLVEADDVQAFQCAVADYLSDAELRKQHGSAARRRVVEKFRMEDVARLWCEYLLGEKPQPLPLRRSA